MSIILGISCYYHDSAACIIKDGKIIAAAAEERFTRKKHDNDFPEQAILFCLDFAKIAMNEVDVVAFYEKPIWKFERILHQHLQHFPYSYKAFINTAGGWFTQKLNVQKRLKEDLNYFGKIVYVPHHVSHAASSFYLSSFDKAVIVTLDGVGEWASTTVGTGDKNGIHIHDEIDFPHSLGLLYSALTTYLGFSANDAEYKVMGLAAYGNPKPFRKQFAELITQFPDGSYQLNMKYFEYDFAEHMFSPELVKLFGYPAREPENKAYSYHENIAAALQERIEQITFQLLKTAYEKYRIPNLCLAGGVALNSVLNGKIISNTPFTNIFIPPDPSDAGGAMGAALWTLQNYSKELPKRKVLSSKKDKTTVFSPYLGPKFAWHHIQSLLEKHKLKYELVSDREKLIEKATQFLIKQKVIGWFQGRMEWGPRALGNRSILASASKSEMKDIINARVKHRELFRPFAPVILEEQIENFFDSDVPLSPSAKWMLMVYPFKEKKKKLLPAVVHVDGTGRLQTIAHGDNPLYYDLINTYFKKTGIPSIINTSFNVRGEPIVCTPEDAIQCFLKTDIDYLIIDQYIVRK